MTILDTENRDTVRNKIKANGHFAHLCYDAVDTFNEFISGLDGLKLIPVQPEDYLLASDLGRAYNLLPIDALAEALGPVDAVRFLQSFDLGRGDYTKERSHVLDLTLDEIFKGIEKRKKTDIE